jgi:hypothetical protein
MSIWASDLELIETASILLGKCHFCMLLFKLTSGIQIKISGNAP